MADSRPCVVNGPAYGSGFGVLPRGEELLPTADRESLADLLLDRLIRWERARPTRR